MVDTPEFDKDAPFGTIFGDANARYAQGGHLFTSQYKYVPELDLCETSKERKARLAEDRAARKAKFKEEFNAGLSVTVVETPVDHTEGNPLVNFLADQEAVTAEKPTKKEVAETYHLDPTTLHWSKLKRLVEERGQTYKGKSEAIKLLQAEV